MAKTWLDLQKEAIVRAYDNTTTTADYIAIADLLERAGFEWGETIPEGT
mgnify:CR=1 FL=1